MLCMLGTIVLHADALCFEYSKQLFHMLIMSALHAEGFCWLCAQQV